MIYVRDLTRAVAMLLDRLERGGSLGRILGEAFNLGTSNSYAMGEVIGRLSEYAGRKSLRAKKLSRQEK